MTPGQNVHPLSRSSVPVDLREILTEPDEAMRWGVALAAVLVVLAGFAFDRLL